MKLLDLLQKGFGYVLLSMGVSRPTAKPQPQQPGGKGEPRKG